MQFGVVIILVDEFLQGYGTFDSYGRFQNSLYVILCHVSARANYASLLRYIKDRDSRIPNNHSCSQTQNMTNLLLHSMHNHKINHIAKVSSTITFTTNYIPQTIWAATFITNPSYGHPFTLGMLTLSTWEEYLIGFRSSTVIRTTLLTRSV